MPIHNTLCQWDEDGDELLSEIDVKTGDDGCARVYTLVGVYEDEAPSECGFGILVDTDRNRLIERWIQDEDTTDSPWLTGRDWAFEKQAHYAWAKKLRRILRSTDDAFSYEGQTYELREARIGP